MDFSSKQYLAKLADIASLSAWIAALLIAGTAYYYFQSWSRLRDFKGPWLAGWSEYWLFRMTTTGELHMRLYDVSKNYGKIILSCSSHHSSKS